MRSSNYRVNWVTVLVMLPLLAVFGSACSSSAYSESNQPPLISVLEAKHMYLDPLWGTEVNCVASDPEGDTLSFQWSSTGGHFVGDGPTVTWQAPKEYGDYPLVVTVTDSNGNSTKATLTIGVIAREKCCGR